MRIQVPPELTLCIEEVNPGALIRFDNLFYLRGFNDNDAIRLENGAISLLTEGAKVEVFPTAYIVLSEKGE